jgi:ABC-type hemin transport system substrate-binding protein
MLTDEKIIEIAKDVAMANNIGFVDITTAPAIDSTGAEAVEITIAIPRGSAVALGARTARAVSELIRELADAGEQRFPIVRYEGKGASP